MDVFVLLIIFAVGVFRLDKSACIEDGSSAGSSTCEEEYVAEDIPVGNNLMLKKDAEAFTRILKEFDLMV